MKKTKKIIMWSIIATLAIIIAILGYFLYKKNNEVELASRNLYNSNFYELVNYVQNVETYLAKSTISESSTHSAETLTHLWREANLAQTYLASLPIESQELEKTEKFYSWEIKNCDKSFFKHKGLGITKEIRRLLIFQTTPHKNIVK